MGGGGGDPCIRMVKTHLFKPYAVYSGCRMDIDSYELLKMHPTLFWLSALPAITPLSTCRTLQVIALYIMRCPLNKSPVFDV